MKKPAPSPGLVVRYDYLWRDEQQRGREEGAKDRPCAIVIAYNADESGRQSVVLCPITHSPPQSARDAIEIPAKVLLHLGLDDQLSWIVTREVNTVDWNDPGIVPVSRGQWAYGFLPPKMAKSLSEKLIELSREQRLGIVDRGASKK